MAEASMKDILSLLNWIAYIYYLFCLEKKTAEIKDLIDSGGEINAIISAYAA